MKITLRKNTSLKNSDTNEESEFLKILETIPLNNLEIPAVTDAHVSHDNPSEIEKVCLQNRFLRTAVSM